VERRRGMLAPGLTSVTSWSRSKVERMGGGSGWGISWHVGRHGSAGVGRPEINNDIFHLSKHFHLTQIYNDSKHIFPCLKNFK
jgi:hypothetical protein